MEKTVLTVLILCFLLFCAGCSEQQAAANDPADSRTLSLAQTEVTVVVGQAPVALKATLSSGRGAFVWTSSDPQIAAVDENGRVAGLAVGSATVTVTCGTLEPASCLVNVVMPSMMPTFAADPTGVGIAKTISAGTALQLDDTVKFGGESVEAQVSFRSQDAAIASVSDTGVVTGVKAGTTQVQAVAVYMDLEVHMTVQITVLP